MNTLRDFMRQYTYKHIVNIFNNTVDKESAIEYIMTLSNTELEMIREFFYDDYIIIYDLFTQGQMKHMNNN